ncbi:hypothetical protein [Clostridium culturomicium]|uniref:hypothetical protein n=1 Tax=Clostridium culturomicium TaxID=1499683 RepID=UPI0005A75819|nr:hypothetical protein [Clostridium culturomicium]
MSLYLGKLHYWLFNKILWFQGIEESIISTLEKDAADIEVYLQEINNNYGEKLPKLPLEEIIDESNIHGWLQEKINISEGRVAAWSKVLLSRNEGKIKLDNIFISQGMKAGEEVNRSGKTLSTAFEIYNSLNDYILDGMPCDRVDEIIDSNDLRVHWRKRICVHREIWERSGVDVKVFYELRALWMKAFITEVNSNFHFTVLEDGTMLIENSMSSDNMHIYALDL